MSWFKKLFAKKDASTITESTKPITLESIETKLAEKIKQADQVVKAKQLTLDDLIAKIPKGPALDESLDKLDLITSIDKLSNLQNIQIQIEKIKANPEITNKVEAVNS